MRAADLDHPKPDYVVLISTLELRKRQFSAIDTP
jgi:hypothetical protein